MGGVGFHGQSEHRQQILELIKSAPPSHTSDGGAHMKYSLDLPEEEFQRLNQTLRCTILANGRVDSWNSPRVVTTDLSKLSKRYRTVCSTQGDGTNAICFTCDHNPHEFDIWVNPERDIRSESYRVTLLHELTHGYLGTTKGHNAQWRSLFARTLWHYSEHYYSLECLKSYVDLAYYRYTKRGKTESSKQFLERIQQDRDLTFKAAEREHSRVAALLDR